MTKSVTPIDSYDVLLSEELRKLAEKELRETKSTRDNAIRALREWIQKNERIISIRQGKSIKIGLRRSNLLIMHNTVKYLLT